MNLRYGSVCSGIEAATAAWHPLGWKPEFFSEVEAFPSAALSHQHPEVPNLGDMTYFKEWVNYEIDILVGGTPCQSFSVAGLRRGLQDPRGNLALTYLAIADRYKPKYMVWENVPGVLSSSGGRDFGSFVGALAELGYGWAYRVLDAQYFGVAQRRRRVFVVGCLGDWRRAAAVLFERESLSGNPAPSREARQDVAPSIVERFETSGSRLDIAEHDVCGTLSDGAHMGGGLNGQDVYTGRVLAVKTETLPVVFHPTQTPISSESVCHSLGANANATAAVAFSENQRGELRTGDVVTNISAGGGKLGQGYPAVMQETAFGMAIRGREGGSQVELSREVANCIRANTGGGSMGMVASPMVVRRLTPVECERLQGFSDNYTRIPYRNKLAERCPDGPRYKAIGNSMAVPVMAWIGGRIDKLEAEEAL